MKNYGSEWKRRVKAGEFIHGGHIFLPNPAMAEAMACFGYEYLWIDGEHGGYDKEELLFHITAINGAGAGAFVRVAANDPTIIKPVLEMGPNGIIAPMVNSADEAAAFISACTYPPKGIRGFGPRRANRYGTMGNYMETIDDSLVKIVQIEHQTAVKNIDSILEVPGIDAVVVGPFDLSGSMGILGQVLHPDMLAAYRHVVERSKAHHVICGPSLGMGNEEILRFWLDLKPDYMFYGDELGFVRMGAGSALAKIKELRAQD